MKELSKTFCVYPWIHQMTTPTGKVNFCCISHKTFVTDDDGKELTLGKDPFASAWNTQYMRNIRKKMLNGEEVNGCESCYKQEQIGKRSYRQNHNEEWYSKLGEKVINDRVKRSVEQDFKVDLPPVYLDLRLGNLCNLKCRMCNPFNSLLIEKEWNELDASLNGGFTQFWQKYNGVNGHVEPWYESEAFWNDVKNYIPHLKKVYMTGGEPTLIEGNYRFLETCREMGYADKIELFFNLNFTTMKDRFIEGIKGFQWVSINASVDGFHETNEYIRGNSRWPMISGNIEKLMSHHSRNLGMGFSPVVQIYNVLDMTRLLDYIEGLIDQYDHDILVDFLYCYNPSFLDISILPKNVKVRALEKIEAWKKKARIYNTITPKSRFVRNSVDSFINSLNQTLDQEDPEKMRDFLHYTKTLDEKRKQSFKSTFPELSQLLSEAGYEN